MRRRLSLALTVFGLLVAPLLVPSRRLALIAIALAAPSVTAAPQEQVISANGINIRYVEDGQGVPVVFVHGSQSDWRVWKMQREAVAKKYQFIAYSRRYYGSEPWSDGRQPALPVSDRDLAADLAA